MLTRIFKSFLILITKINFQLYDCFGFHCLFFSNVDVSKHLFLPMQDIIGHGATARLPLYQQFKNMLQINVKPVVETVGANEFYQSITVSYS